MLFRLIPNEVNKTPKLQTARMTRKNWSFFTAYQTHFLKQYPVANTIKLQLL